MTLFLVARFPGNDRCSLHPLAVTSTAELAEAQCVEVRDGYAPIAVDGAMTDDALAAIGWQRCPCCGEPYVNFPKMTPETIPAGWLGHVKIAG